MRQDSATSVSLLERVKLLPHDETAWNAFVSRYQPAIVLLCRHWNLQEADSEDVAQLVMQRLMKHMVTFKYDSNAGSFRSWIKTVARNVIKDHMVHSNRPGLGRGGDENQCHVDALESVDNLAQHMELACERAFVNEAIAKVKPRVSSETWQAFELTAVEGMTARDVSRKSGMSVGAVYAAKSRVQRMLKLEVAFESREQE